MSTISGEGSSQMASMTDFGPRIGPPSEAERHPRAAAVVDAPQCRNRFDNALIPEIEVQTPSFRARQEGATFSGCAVTEISVTTKQGFR